MISKKGLDNICEHQTDGANDDADIFFSKDKELYLGYVLKMNNSSDIRGINLYLNVDHGCMTLTGVYPPLITPADRSGQVDTESLAEHVKTLRENGINGFFPCGTAGEFASLTHEQRRLTIETVRSEVPESTVLAGCGGTAVGSVVKQIKQAKAIGADAAVVIAPYYLDPTSDGLKTYFRNILNESQLPIILYNIPHLTKCSIPVDLVSKLATDEQVVGIKDSSGDPRYHWKLLAETPSEFSVLQGITDQAVSSLRAGGDGIVPGVANVIPEPVIELFEACERDDYDQALKIHEETFSPLLNALNDVPLAAGLKYILRKQGSDSGYPLPPLSQLTSNQRTSIDEWIEATN